MFSTEFLRDSIIIRYKRNKKVLEALYCHGYDLTDFSERKMKHGHLMDKLADFVKCAKGRKDENYISKCTNSIFKDKKPTTQILSVAYFVCSYEHFKDFTIVTNICI